MAKVVKPLDAIGFFESPRERQYAYFHYIFQQVWQFSSASLSVLCSPTVSRASAD